MTQLDTNGDTYAEQTIVNDRHKEHVKDLIFYLTLTLIVICSLARVFLYLKVQSNRRQQFPTVQADERGMGLTKLPRPNVGYCSSDDPQLNKPLINGNALDGDKI